MTRTKRARFAALALALPGFTLVGPAPAAAQTPPELSVELWTGVVAGADRLGNTNIIEPGGYFFMGVPSDAPMVGLGVVSAPTWLGLRPHLRFEYGFPADVEALWNMCPPWAACPAIAIRPEARTSRMEATLGVDFPILDANGPVRPRASVGAGIRHHRISWDDWGDLTDSFYLLSGAHGETDFLAKVGLEVGVPIDRWEIVARGSADFSRFGPGSVNPGADAWPLYPPGGFDLGRVSDNVYTLMVGVRRGLW